MPPIPIHTASPINTKSTRQPSTTDPVSPYSPTKVNTEAPTTPSSATTTTSASQTYPAARPGAIAFPAPTGTAANAYTPRQPSPTPTTQAPAYDGPPMPQPGAVPDMNATANMHRASLPPPPRAGEKVSSVSAPSPTTAAATTTSHSYPPPPQLGIPPPSMNYAPTHSTATSTMPSAFIPAYVAPMPLPSSPHQQQTNYTFGPTAPGGLNDNVNVSDPRRGSLEHPPGYVQNPRAADMTAAQRAAQEMQERESGGSGIGIGGVLQGVVGEAGFLGGGSDGGVRNGSIGSSNGDGGAWEKAKSWLGGVAEMAAEVEGEVWKRVGGVGK